MPARHLDAPRRCACGSRLRRTSYQSSGSVDYVAVCEVLLRIWRTDPHGPWATDQPAGHTAVLSVNGFYAARGLKYWRLETSPGDYGHGWPFVDPANYPPDVDLHDQVVRAVLDCYGHRVSADDAWERIQRAVQATGIGKGPALPVVRSAFTAAHSTAAGSLQRHPADCEHRSYGQLAHCVWDKYVKANVKGKGRHAAVSFCSRATVVRLFNDQSEAVRQLRRWEDWACSERCRDHHDLRLLPELPAKTKKAA